MIAQGNLFEDIPAELAVEQFTPLLSAGDVRIVRIVSDGHASPPDFWYDQNDTEWVMVLQGAAGVLFEGEAGPRALKRGDHLHIPPHVRHRVAWSEPMTVWLAVHVR